MIDRLIFQQITKLKNLQRWSTIATETVAKAVDSSLNPKPCWACSEPTGLTFYGRPSCSPSCDREMMEHYL